MDVFSLRTARGLQERSGRDACEVYCLRFAQAQEPDLDAMVFMGDLYRDGWDPGKAEHWYRAAAELGSPEGRMGLFHLCCRYMYVTVLDNGIHLHRKMDGLLDLDKAETLLKYCEGLDDDRFAQWIPQLYVWLAKYHLYQWNGIRWDRTRAKGLLEHALLSGRPEAQIGYGDYMSYGFGGMDAPEAFRYYSLAAEQNSVEAMDRLADFSADMRHSKATQLLTSKWGLALLAFLALGVPQMLLDNSGSDPVNVFIANWIERLVPHADLFAAICMVGMSAVLILGGIRNKEKAWWIAGFLVAATSLYEKWIGSPQMLQMAEVGSQLASNVIYYSGVLISIANMAYLIGVLRYLRKGRKLAFSWIERAGQTDTPEGVYLYANALYQGRYSRKKRKLAVAQYHRAAELGSSKARVELGDLYRTGKMVPKDHERAFALYRQAALREDGDGQYMLGYCYENCIGVPDTPGNMETAHEWYKKGRKNGSDRAVKRLNRPMRQGLRYFLKRIFPGYRRSEELRQKVDVVAFDVTVLKAEVETIRQSLDELTMKLELSRREMAEQAEREREALEESLDRASALLLQQFSDYCEEAGQAAAALAARNDNRCRYREAEACLKNKFADIWERLQHDTQISLISSRTLFALVKESAAGKAFDYSGIVISATSALENELSIYFFRDYCKFLDEHGMEYPESLKGSKDKGRNAKFALGDMLYILEPEFCRKGKKRSYSAGTVCSEQLRSYLKKLLKEEYYTEQQPTQCFFLPWPGSMYGAFVVQCEQIREKYRNPSAHTKVVQEKLARGCCHQLMGEFEAAEKLDTADSILIQLFEMIK